MSFFPPSVVAPNPAGGCFHLSLFIYSLCFFSNFALLFYIPIIYLFIYSKIFFYPPPNGSVFIMLYFGFLPSGVWSSRSRRWWGASGMSRRWPTRWSFPSSATPPTSTTRSIPFPKPEGFPHPELLPQNECKTIIKYIPKSPDRSFPNKHRNTAIYSCVRLRFGRQIANCLNHILGKGFWWVRGKTKVGTIWKIRDVNKV